MKRNFLSLFVILLIPLLSACGSCNHQWMPATCNTPQYCTKCGVYNGTALGHDWIQTGVDTKYCSRCGITQQSSNTSSYAVTEPSNPSSSGSNNSGVAYSTTPSSNQTATHWYDNHIAKIKAQVSSVYVPEDIFFLSSPETKTVLGKKGYCIYERSTPNSSAKDLGKLDNGTVVTVLARQNGFALYVTPGGHYAWGTNEYIVDGNDAPYLVSGKKEPGKAMVMTNKNKVNVRYDPYGVFPVMGTMAPNTKVTAYRTVNGYTYVETGSVKGWVYSEFLS